MGCGPSTSAGPTDPELEYRCKNSRGVRQGYMDLIAAINTANGNFLSTPNHLKSVAEAYVHIAAGLNHGGGGGAAAAAASGVGGGRTQINREAAVDACTATQAFSNAMRIVAERDYPRYRDSVKDQVLRVVGEALAKANETCAKGKGAENALVRYCKTVGEVDSLESKCAKKGTDPSMEKNYEALISKRSQAEDAYKAARTVFYELYEDLMGSSQEVLVQSMDVYLDLTVGYNERMMSVIDSSGTPERSRSRPQFDSNEPTK